MNIAVIGATGNAGRRIVDEAVRRGHTVNALVRTPAKMASRTGVVAKAADVKNPESLVTALRGIDVLITAFNPERASQDYADAAKKGYQAIVTAAEKAGVKRALIVGGAGSLKVPGGAMDVVDTPTFPAEYKLEASTFRDIFRWVENEAKLDWLYISPSAFFAPGERTGKFRVGGNELLVDAKGQSAISMEDFAIALLDEVEKPARHRQQFTVGY